MASNDQDYRSGMAGPGPFPQDQLSSVGQLYVGAQGFVQIQNSKLTRLREIEKAAREVVAWAGWFSFDGEKMAALRAALGEKEG